MNDDIKGLFLSGGVIVGIFLFTICGIKFVNNTFFDNVPIVVKVELIGVKK